MDLENVELPEEPEAESLVLTQELHDSVTQTIYSMTLTLKAAQTLLEKDPSRLGGLLAELDDLAKNALDQMRTMLSQARPEVLEVVSRMLRMESIQKEMQFAVNRKAVD